jgi:hypothetical protein
LVILCGIVLGESHMFGLQAFSQTASDEESFSDAPEQKHRTIERPVGAKRIRSNKAQASRTRSFLPLAHRGPFSYVRMPSFLNLRTVPPNLRI